MNPEPSEGETPRADGNGQIQPVGGVGERPQEDAGGSHEQGDGDQSQAWVSTNGVTPSGPALIVFIFTAKR